MEIIMKKTFAILLALLMIAAVCGCGAEKEKAPAPGTPLSTFYQSVIDMQPADADALIFFEENNPDLIESFYPGLNDIGLSQKLLYMPPIATHPCEIFLVEAKNSEDAEAVAGIFKARIEMGADNKSYPESAEGWQLYAQVHTSGNFVCMIVLPSGYIIPENVFAIDLAETAA